MKIIAPGFTILDLMIALTITGIAIVIAIPSYQGFTARAQIAEVQIVGADISKHLGNWLANQNSMPSSISSLTVSTSGKYIESIHLDGTTSSPVIQIVFDSDDASSLISGMSFVLHSSDAGRTWSCINSTISRNLLPRSCI